MTWPVHGMEATLACPPRASKPRAEDRPLIAGDPCWLALSVADLLRAWREAGLMLGAAIGVGIDPGSKGAVALVLRHGGVVRGASVFPLPVQADPTKTGRQNRKKIDGRELYSWLRLLGGELTAGAVVRIAVEKHLIIPGSRGAKHHDQGGADGTGDGAAAGFNYSTARSALTAGKISGLLEALSVERTVILLIDQTPKTWRDALGLAGGGDKQYLLERARVVYPQLVSRLTAQTHHDRAEALLLGTYALDAPC